jgi:hypothetical protein
MTMPVALQPRFNVLCGVTPFPGKESSSLSVENHLPVRGWSRQGVAHHACSHSATIAAFQCAALPAFNVFSPQEDLTSSLDDVEICSSVSTLG